MIIRAPPCVRLRARPSHIAIGASSFLNPHSGNNQRGAGGIYMTVVLIFRTTCAYRNLNSHRGAYIRGPYAPPLPKSALSCLWCLLGALHKERFGAKTPEDTPQGGPTRSVWLYANPLSHIGHMEHKNHHPQQLCGPWPPPNLGHRPQ